MIEVYKISSGKYDDIVTSWLTGRRVESSYDLRNHRYSIYQSPVQLEIADNISNRQRVSCRPQLSAVSNKLSSQNL